MMPLSAIQYAALADLNDSHRQGAASSGQGAQLAVRDLGRPKARWSPVGQEKDTVPSLTLLTDLLTTAVDNSGYSWTRPSSATRTSRPVWQLRTNLDGRNLATDQTVAPRVKRHRLGGYLRGRGDGGDSGGARMPTRAAGQRLRMARRGKRFRRELAEGRGRAPGRRVNLDLPGLHQQVDAVLYRVDRDALAVR
jgi:hypothetical protein